MKNYFPLILIGLLITIFLLKSQPGRDVINYKVENKNLKLLVADERGEWERGLMNVWELRNADGMIFIFPDKQHRSFWNKNTFADLDVYWISDDKVVGRSFLPSIEETKEIVVVNSPTSVNKVIELLR